MQKSEGIANLAGALALAQGKIKGAVKDSANPFFKSKYADLASVWEACREPLTAAGLSVVQLPSYKDGVATVCTMLLHKSGEWITDDLSAPVKDTTPQAIGSAITYLRRYALASVAGVAPEDDDGNAASGKTEAQNGHSKTDTKAAEEKAAKLADELRSSLQDAKDQGEFDAACLKIKTAADKGWISAKQRDDLKPLANQILGALPKPQPAQASK